MLQEMAAQKMVLVEVQAQVLHLRIDNMNLHGRAQQASSLQEELEAEKAAKAEAAQVSSPHQTCRPLVRQLEPCCLGAVQCLHLVPVAAVCTYLLAKQQQVENASSTMQHGPGAVWASPTSC